MFICGMRFHRSLGPVYVLRMDSETFLSNLQDCLETCFATISAQISPFEEGKISLQKYLKNVKALSASDCMEYSQDTIEQYFGSCGVEVRTDISATLRQFYESVCRLPFNVKRLIFHSQNTERSGVLHQIAKVFCVDDIFFDIGKVNFCKMSVVPRKPKKPNTNDTKQPPKHTKKRQRTKREVDTVRITENCPVDAAPPLEAPKSMECAYCHDTRAEMVCTVCQTR